jgi:hypothetical protein
MRFIKWLGVVVGLLVVVFYWQVSRPIAYPPGILIAAEPSQINLPADTPAFQQGAFRLKPLSVFSIDGRVLHRKVYRFDKESRLSPVDLAMGWGAMSDQRVLDQLNITQSGRFYWYRYSGQPPIPKNEIISHSTNVHIIPSTAKIARQCKRLRPGSLVRLSGDLVEASGPGINSWKSSLSRTDSGNSACELMWVKEMSILNEIEPEDRQVAIGR